MGWAILPIGCGEYTDWGGQTLHLIVCVCVSVGVHSTCMRMYMHEDVGLFCVCVFLRVRVCVLGVWRPPIRRGGVMFTWRGHSEGQGAAGSVLGLLDSVLL